MAGKDGGGINQQEPSIKGPNPFKFTAAKGKKPACVREGKK